MTDEYIQKVRLAISLCNDGTPGPRWTVPRLMAATGLKNEEEIRRIDEMVECGYTADEILEELDSDFAEGFEVEKQ
jgi:hypothetical protein